MSSLVARTLRRRGDVIARSGARDEHVLPEHRARLELPNDLRFEALHDQLSRAVVYKIFPNRLREPQRIDLARPMREHGENWASILHHFDKEREGRDLLAALGQIVGDIDDYRTTAVGGYVIPEIRHARVGGAPTWLGALQESDGTLRVAGILTALLQEPPLGLVGFEEPELTVHPGAIGVLFDHFREAATRGQVLLTTHSSELLDLLDIDEVRVVERRDGATRVSRVHEAQRALVKQRLATTSELVWSEGLRSATGTDG
jgi:predicted ATPase